jgi:ribulose-5-phosphate 4-epimerase/fuculose-1-phosphate aldolase
VAGALGRYKVGVGQVPILDFNRQIDTQERGQMARDAIGDSMALVLKNHGIAVCGDSIENATIAMFALQEGAQLHWIAAQVGQVQKISRSVLTGARKEEFYSYVWGHYARLDSWHVGSAGRDGGRPAAISLPP